jgi:hypothetical protein
MRYREDAACMHTGQLRLSARARVMHLRNDISLVLISLARYGTYDLQKRCPQGVAVKTRGNERHMGHLRLVAFRSSFAKLRSSQLLIFGCFAGHPTKTMPESATSPEVSSVCSHSILLSSIDAPESNLDPERRSQLRI